MTKTEAYRVLGIKENASTKEIKSAFRWLAKKHHPDMKGGDAVRFRAIEEAYTFLTEEKQNTKTNKHSYKHHQPRSFSDTISCTIYVFDFGLDEEYMGYQWCDGVFIYTESVYVTKERYFAAEFKSRNVDNLKINLKIERLDVSEDYVKEDNNTLVYFVKIDFWDFLIGKIIKCPPLNSYWTPIPVFNVWHVSSKPLTYHQRIETCIVKDISNTNVRHIYVDITFDPYVLPLGQQILYHIWELKEYLKKRKQKMDYKSCVD